MRCYSWEEERGRWLPHILNVLTFRGPEISEVVPFLDVTRRLPDPGTESFAEDRTFERFGLPNELPA